MSRNQMSRFGVNPSVDISRSRFKRDSVVKFTGNVGDVIPFYLDEVLPGDTFDVSTSKLVRLQTLMSPIMDNLYLDTYYFFIPNRLTWTHWKEFMGENTESAWTPETKYSIPQIRSPQNGWNKGTIADYMGIPIGKKISHDGISALPFRAYALVCDQWFRDQNLQQPLNIPLGDNAVVGSNGTDIVNDIAKGGMPFRASKYRDYFTSCLPAPQKGDDVLIPLGNVAPVVPINQIAYGKDNDLWLDSLKKRNKGLAGDLVATDVGYVSGVNNFTLNDYTGSPHLIGYGFNAGGSSELYQISQSATQGSGTDKHPLFTNLYADLAGATASSINSLRLAFATQKLLEKDARGGTRYFEILKNHFGVVSPDATQQRTEYLGGNRIPLNINQVIQTSETNNTPAGDTTAYSLTMDSHSDFTKSFTEHGYVLGVCVVRYDHTYQQGIERSWFRRDRFDYYFPVFANIGEQPVLKQELYFDETDGKNREVFGYQEAWAEYRYKPNRVAGEMRSSYAQPLDMWHLADNYSSRPALSSSWISEDKSALNRCLAVSDRVSDQILFDIFIENNSTRPMPLYSIPGLIDHH